MKHIITKVNKAQFTIEWEGVKGSLINLNFNPLINNYNLKNSFVIAHWQAIPKGLRRWGLYYSTIDEYYSCDAESVMLSNNLKSMFLQIPELNFPEIRPTAVVLYIGARVFLVENNYLIS